LQLGVQLVVQPEPAVQVPPQPSPEPQATPLQLGVQLVVQLDGGARHLQLVVSQSQPPQQPLAWQAGSPCAQLVQQLVVLGPASCEQLTGFFFL
jgi:hypothetical protein